MITAAVKLSEKLERKEPRAPIYSTAFRHALSWNSLKATNCPTPNYTMQSSAQKARCAVYDGIVRRQQSPRNALRTGSRQSRLAVRE